MATEKVVTVAFRLAFPEVFEPKASAQGGKLKFSITMLFPDDGQPLVKTDGGADLMALRRLAFAACKEKWGADRDKWPANLRTIDPKTYVSPTGKDGWPIRNGSLVEWQGFGGHTFIRASSEYRPGVVDSRVKPILDRSMVFGGLICRAQVNAYAYDMSGNPGVSFGLDNLQILKDDGTVFSGREKAEDAFSSFGDPDAGTPSQASSEEPW